MFDILQGDMTRSKVILTFTCLKMYIARSGDTSGSRTTLFWIHVLNILLIRITIANLCPNMLHLDALDFSEFLSEEVKFLLMCIVDVIVNAVKHTRFERNFANPFTSLTSQSFEVFLLRGSQIGNSITLM